MDLSLDEIIKATEGEWQGNPYLKANVQFVNTDSRVAIPLSLFIPLIGERFNAHQFVEKALADGALFSLWQRDQGEPPTNRIILVENTLTALQALATFYRKKLNVKVIAITGSNGKTTTKDILADLLSVSYTVHKTEGNLNNHIGVPLTLLAMPEQTEIAVIEMGMNGFGEIKRLSEIACPNMALIS